MRSVFFLTCALAVGVGLPSQSTFTIPHGYATAEAPSSTNVPWGYGAANGSRGMYTYDASHFTDQGIAGPTLITRMRWRGDGGVAFPGGGTYGLAVITVSTMPTSITVLGNSLPFAGLHGADVVEVYRGAVAVGALSGTTPNDWHIDVTLQKPFLFDPRKGSPILIELACDETRYVGPPMGNIRHDNALTPSAGINRMYNLTSHTAAVSNGTCACGAVVELTGTWPIAPPVEGRFVIPHGAYDLYESDSSTNVPWGYGAANGSRGMYAYNASHFTGQGITGPTTITRMRWRGDGGVVFPGGGIYGLAIITISTMPNPISVLGTNVAFGGQHGSDRVEVYRGAVAVGALSGTVPNDWHIDVILQKPFVYDPRKGNPILIELACDQTQYVGPPMGNVRHDLVLAAGGGVNRMYELTSHTAAFSSGTCECGAVVELFCGMFSDVGGISIVNGGTQRLMVDGSLANAGKNYWIFGSVTGSAPGVNLLGVHIPLNPDLYTDFTISAANSSALRNFRGTLDSNGQAIAEFVVPANTPTPFGFTLYHANVIYDANRFLMGSCAVGCRMN